MYDRFQILSEVKNIGIFDFIMNNGVLFENKLYISSETLFLGTQIYD